MPTLNIGIAPCQHIAKRVYDGYESGTGKRRMPLIKLTSGQYECRKCGRSFGNWPADDRGIDVSGDAIALNCEVKFSDPKGGM